MTRLDVAFIRAKQAYPNHWIEKYERVEVPGLCDDDPPEEMSLPHTWRLVDAVAASFRTPEREGMLVLQEYRPRSDEPYNHWGYMVSKDAMSNR